MRVINYLFSSRSHEKQKKALIILQDQWLLFHAPEIIIFEARKLLL